MQSFPGIGPSISRDARGVPIPVMVGTTDIERVLVFGLVSVCFKENKLDLCSKH